MASILVISTLAYNLSTYDFYAPILANYIFVLEFCNFPGLSFPGFAFDLRNSQIRLTKYPKHVENDYGIFWGVTILPPLKEFRPRNSYSSMCMFYIRSFLFMSFTEVGA